MLDKKTIRVIIRPMKKIHFLLALIFVLIVGHASAFNATETIELFYGGLEHDSEGTTEELLDELRQIYLCDIGCSREECKDILEENGWTCSSENTDVIYFKNENGWEHDGKRVTCLFYLFDEEGRMTQCGAVFEDYSTYDITLTYLAVHYGFGVDRTIRGFPSGTQAFYSFQHGLRIFAVPTSSERGNVVCINIMEIPGQEK